MFVSSSAPSNSRSLRFRFEEGEERTLRVEATDSARVCFASSAGVAERPRARCEVGRMIGGRIEPVAGARLVGTGADRGSPDMSGGVVCARRKGWWLVIIVLMEARQR